MEENVHYCFISYKHKDNKKFVLDSHWAEVLPRALARMKIQIPPLDESRVIRPGKNNYVDRVFKDTYNLNTGEFRNVIVEALKLSKKLVLIVSPEMIEDQNNKVDTDKSDALENAWIYWEIREFMKTHTFEDIIPVVITKEKMSENLIPRPLMDASLLEPDKELFASKKFFKDEDNDRSYKEALDKDKVAYLKEYWLKRNCIMVNDKVDVDVVASTIACSIFDIGARGENFFLSFRESEKRTARAKTIAALALIGLLVFLAAGIYLRVRMLRSDNLISQSIAANNYGDRQASEFFALEAVKQGFPLNDKAYSHLRNFINPVNATKLAVLHSWVEFSSDGSKLCLYDSDSDSRHIKVLSSEDFREETRIEINNRPMRIIPSQDMSYIAVLDWDTLRIYNTASRQLIKTAYLDAGSDSYACKYGFSNDNNSFISCRWEGIDEIQLHHNRRDSLILGEEHRFINGRLFCMEKDEKSFRLYEVHNNPLCAELIVESSNYNGRYWDYSPATGVCAVTSDTGIAIISNQGEQLLTWDGFDGSSVNYLAFSSSGRLACSQGGKLVFPFENTRPIQVDDKRISWVSKDKLTYTDTKSIPHLLDLNSGHTYSLAFDMNLPHFISNGDYIYNYISCINQVGGYGEVGPGTISCIKYPQPSYQDEDELIECHYYGSGKKILGKYGDNKMINGKRIQTKDLHSGKVLWSSTANVWGYDLISETAALEYELIDINTGNKVADLGWRSKYLSENHIVTTVGFSPDTVRIMCTEDMTTKFTCVCSIDDVDYVGKRFIVCRCKEEYMIYDTQTETQYIVRDSLHNDRRDYCISDDGRFFIRTVPNRDEGSIRNHTFYVYDMNSGKRLFCDRLDGAVLPRAIANNRIICFIAQNKVAFYDIESQRFTQVKNLNFDVSNLLEKVSENIYLVAVYRSGIYEINIEKQTFTKKPINSDGGSLAFFAPNFIYTDGRLVDMNSNEILATGIGAVNRISEGWIYYGGDIEYRIPLLSNRQLYNYCKTDFGNRVLTEKEMTSYMSMVN